MGSVEVPLIRLSATPMPNINNPTAASHAHAAHDTYDATHPAPITQRRRA